MRSFENISRLIRDRRVNHPKHPSQSELSQILGYKNGQFISNVERGLCSIPLKMLKKVSIALDIPEDEVKEALMKDYQNTVDDYFKLENAKVRSNARPAMMDESVGPGVSA